MANVGLHSGILMHQGTEMTLPSHLDMSHIVALEGPKESTHLGTLDLWAYKRKVDAPFLSVAGIGSNNIIYTEDDYLTYDVAAASDASIKIVKDISGLDEVGKGQSPFEILVDSPSLGGHGQVFKFDPMLKEELMVTGEQIRQAGEHWVYTVKRVDSDQPLNKFFLQNGTRLIPYHTERSPEFSQEYASFAIKGPKTNRYIIPVGQVEQQVHYHVTTKVAEYRGTGNISIPASKKKEMDKMFEYYFNMQGVEASGLTTFDQAIKSQPDAVTAAMKEGRVQVAIASMYDSLALKFLAKGEAEYQLWGSGGKRNAGGVDEYLAPVGAWQQLDTGYKTEFNIGDFTLDTLKAALYEYFGGKIDWPVAGGEPVLEVMTGMGGFQLINKLITEQVNSQALIVHAKDFGNISGEALSLSFKPSWYVRITIPMLATLSFNYNPAFDPIETSVLINPVVANGFKLSSYSFIIYEENQFGGSDNIKMIRSKEGGGQVFMNVINSTSSHPLFKQSTSINGVSVSASQGSNLKTGYAAYFRKKMDSLWVKDPTRILKIVAKHPITNKSF